MRPFHEAILYEKDGSLNLGWLFLTGILLLLGTMIVLSATFKVDFPMAAWVCLQTCFLSVLAASTTQNKAKIANDAPTSTDLTDPPNLHTGE